MAKIRFENVEKYFGNTPVIKGLNLTIRDGEFFTFVGPSGCGKSTILNMIAGLEAVSGGSIYFDERNVGQLSPKDRDVAFVFQSYALYPHMRVYDNIAFPLKMKKVSSENMAAEVKRVAALLGIDALLQRKPRELSGGERQRVALARAIIRRPQVFLMDEPLSNLDAKLRVRMRAELKRLHQEINVTTIYVTHDQEEAMSLSDRIAVLHQGEVQQYGTPEEVYTGVNNMFVAGFIGSPPMNFIPAKVTQRTPLAIEVNGMRFAPQTQRAPSGEELILGVRPEDIAVSSAKGTYTAKVLLLEFSGAGYWADLDWQGIKLKGFAQQDKGIILDDKAFFDIPIDKCHLFDTLTGKKL
jgi:multiple sugar transport system ATP-binding protein